MVDATGATVDNEAELMAASARLSWPLARGYLAVSVQDLMAADSRRILLENERGNGLLRRGDARQPERCRQGSGNHGFGRFP